MTLETSSPSHIYLYLRFEIFPCEIFHVPLIEEEDNEVRSVQVLFGLLAKPRQGQREMYI